MHQGFPCVEQVIPSSLSSGVGRVEFAAAGSLYKKQIEARAALKGTWEMPEQQLWSLPCPERGKESCPCSSISYCVLNNEV